MDISDIIFAITCKDVCNVTYWDGTTDIVPKGIGELYKDLCRVSNHGRYFMIGRSTLICENNIIHINPARGKLVMAFDTLNKKHLVLKGYSDDLLRELRKNIS